MYGENTNTMAIPIYRVLPYPVIQRSTNIIVTVPTVLQLLHVYMHVYTSVMQVHTHAYMYMYKYIHVCTCILYTYTMDITPKMCKYNVHTSMCTVYVHVYMYMYTHNVYIVLSHKTFPYAHVHVVLCIYVLLISRKRPCLIMEVHVHVDHKSTTTVTRR